ncbi:hypothetical protein [Sphingomonas sp. CROZ-RG-20F-R02-07]|uniref:hypothetical protein n=1 Tax=Sphingomonas sp. CROZ-RG-20F-R02-07 TaxID=2914832 RepID=UPI001F5A16B6|nr:hypothetical protein [Sphingomonas sp. CROZ-RG-20F-R02-07]
MANEETRASSPDAERDDPRLDDSVDSFAETRRKMQELVRGAAAMLRNQQVAGRPGAQPTYPAIDHGTLRILLMNLVGVTQEAHGAFDARLKHTLGQGIILDDRPRGDKGPRGHRRYLLMDVLQLALVFQLQRGLVDPAAAAAFVIQNREKLEVLWVEASGARDHYWLEIEIDAYAAIGGERKGRPSGRVGALAFPGSRARRGIAEPAPVLRLDLAALRDRVGSSMLILGDAFRTAQKRFPDLDHVSALQKHLDEPEA